MGWNTTITSSKQITEDDIQKIVDTLPQEFKGMMSMVNKQDWGWPCYADIQTPKGNQVDISGSYAISGESAKEFVDIIVNGLRDNGHTSVANTRIV